MTIPAYWQSKKPEEWASDYESLVEELQRGYSMCIHEYTNDLACRHILEEMKETLTAGDIWRRVETTDRKLRKLLRPTKVCIHGDYPRSYFWYWGYPPDSPQLEEDLRTMGAI